MPFWHAGKTLCYAAAARRRLARSGEPSTRCPQTFSPRAFIKTIVHIVGTGTIGEPLLGLFTDFRDKMGIDEVTFHKRTPLLSDRAKLNHLMARGAHLAVDEEVRD